MITKSHVDITGRADIGANMAAYTAVIIGIDVTSEGFLVFLDSKYCVLRAINYTVIAFETHAATHAATRFGYCLLLGKRYDTILEMT